MFSSLQRSPATLAAILAGVVAFALLNPFCCHLLPIFEAEPAPGERAVAEVKSPCPGKPEAVPTLAVEAPEFVAVSVDLPRPVVVAVPIVADRRIEQARASRAGPPRHVLFGVFLI